MRVAFNRLYLSVEFAGVCIKRYRSIAETEFLLLSLDPEKAVGDVE